MNNFSAAQWYYWIKILLQVVMNTDALLWHRRDLLWSAPRTNSNLHSFGFILIFVPLNPQKLHYWVLFNKSLYIYKNTPHAHEGTERGPYSILWDSFQNVVFFLQNSRFSFSFFIGYHMIRGSLESAGSMQDNNANARTQKYSHKKHGTAAQYRGLYIYEFRCVNMQNLQLNGFNSMVI